MLYSIVRISLKAVVLVEGAFSVDPYGVDQLHRDPVLYAAGASSPYSAGVYCSAAFVIPSL